MRAACQRTEDDRPQIPGQNKEYGGKVSVTFFSVLCLFQALSNILFRLGHGLYSYIMGCKIRRTKGSVPFPIFPFLHVTQCRLKGKHVVQLKILYCPLQS